MKSMVFDSGPIITLAMNNLLWLLEPLEQKFQGQFYITPGVRGEIIDRPLTSKKFKFEAIQVLKHVELGTLKVVDKDLVESNAKRLLEIINHIYSAKGEYIQIAHYGEIEALAAALTTKAEAIVIDERTTRLLIENPKKEAMLLQTKLHTKIKINKDNMEKIMSITKDIQVIRSVELVCASFELGLLDRYLPPINNPRRNLLDAVLWGLKLNGCAVSGDEIDEMLRILS